MKRKILLSELTTLIGVKIIGEDIEIDGLNLCNRKSQYKNVLSYAMNERYLMAATENQAIAAIILNRELSDYALEHMKDRFSILISPSPEVDFYKIHTHLFHNTDFYDKFDFPAQIGTNPNIHSTAIIEDGVIIGNDVFIEAYAIIKRRSVLGDNVYIGCHSTIGGEGFQIIKDGETNIRVVHAGGCYLSNESVVSHGSVVCNALFEGATFVGENAMIDGLAWVGHNCVVEDNAVLTAGVILCGSSHVKKGAWLGCNTTILNNVVVGERALTGIGCTTIRDILPGTTAVGNPARTISRQER